MSATAQPGQKANKYGHKYDGQLKTLSGYAVCSACGCHENTGESITECPKSINLDNIIVPVGDRVAAHKERQEALGRVRRPIYATPSEHDDIKALLKRLRYKPA